MAAWKDFYKKAQMDFGWPQAAVAFSPSSKHREELAEYWKPGGRGETANRMSDAAVMEGLSQGVQNAIPGFIDTIGAIGGGIGGGLGSWSGGGSFTEGFKDGMRQGAEDIKPVSDNIRSWIDAIGGKSVNDAIRGEFDSAADHYYRNFVGQDTDEHGRPSDNAVGFARDLNLLSSAREGAKTFGEFYATWPMFAVPAKGVFKAIGATGKAVGTGARAAGQATGVARAVAPVARAVATKSAPIAKAVGPVIRGAERVFASPTPYAAMSAHTAGRSRNLGLDGALEEYRMRADDNARSIEGEIDAIQSPFLPASQKWEHWNKYRDLTGKTNVGGFIPMWRQVIAK